MTIRVHHYALRDGIEVCKYCGMVRNKDRAHAQLCSGKLPPVAMRELDAAAEELDPGHLARVNADLQRDRDEWLAQHENLLAMYQAEVARSAELCQLAEERLAHANQLQADIEAEQEGRLVLRRRFGARDNETMEAFIERLAIMAAAVPAEAHERGWQWRPVGDGAFAPPFGTIRACRSCGCLVAGGPTACGRCAVEAMKDA